MKPIKHRKLIACLLLGLGVFFSSNAHAFKVLFIGNSFTGYAVSTLERFTRAAPNGQDQFSYEWVGGMTLLEHASRFETLRAIREGAFDYVVLQDLSLQPINNPNGFRQAIALLVNEVRQSGAEPILYMTWARLANGNYPNDQATVKAAYLAEAARYDLAVIRAGEVWNFFYQNNRTLFNKLYDPDLIHPSIFGTFAIASSVYKVLYGNNQSWTPTTGLDSASASAIRQAALQLNQTRPSYFNQPPAPIPPSPSPIVITPILQLLLDE